MDKSEEKELRSEIYQYTVIKYLADLFNEIINRPNAKISHIASIYKAFYWLIKENKENLIIENISPEKISVIEEDIKKLVDKRLMEVKKAEEKVAEEELMETFGDSADVIIMLKEK